MSSDSPQHITTAFWNLQNLFDLDGSPIALELGYTPLSGWDRAALQAKVRNVAEAIRSMFDGHGPDVLGLCEIQNRRVADYLLQALAREDYTIVMDDGDGQHPAGTALLYSRTAFDESATQVNGFRVHRRFDTCDLLEVSLTTHAGAVPLTVLVNHWPAREEPYATAFRQTLAGHCARRIDQRLKMPRPEYVELTETEVSRQRILDRWSSAVLVMGSFNDSPWADSLTRILNAHHSLEQIHAPLHLPTSGLPSWRSYSALQPGLFNPTWQLLAWSDRGTCADAPASGAMAVYDQLLLSQGLMTGRSGLQVQTDEHGQPELSCPAAGLLRDDRGRPVSFDCESKTGFSDRLPVGLCLQTSRHTSPVDANAATDATQSADV